jgi:hypothetical protein
MALHRMPKKEPPAWLIAATMLVSTLALIVALGIYVVEPLIPKAKQTEPAVNPPIATEQTGPTDLERERITVRPVPSVPPSTRPSPSTVPATVSNPPAVTNNAQLPAPVQPLPQPINAVPIIPLAPAPQPIPALPDLPTGGQGVTVPNVPTVPAPALPQLPPITEPLAPILDPVKQATAPITAPLKPITDTVKEVTKNALPKEVTDLLP